MVSTQQRPTWVTLFCVAMMGCACLTSTSHAQISSTDRQQMVNSLRDAATNFDAERISDLEASKQRLIKRAGDVADYFNRSTGAANRDAWMDYLKTDLLLDAIEADESVATMGREAVALQQRLIGTAPGLELTALRRLRDAVNELIPALRFRNKERTGELLAKQLETVAEKFEEMDSVPSVDDMATANLILGLLAETNQVAYAKDTLRQRFGHPNVAVWIDESVVQQVVNRPVNEVRPVNECILGTTINGTATMTGLVTANLLASQGSVGLNVSLAGHVVSHNRGYNKPVHLRTTGYGDVTASRNLYISESGVSMEPAYAQAVLRTEINSISHKCRLVRRIANKKAAETKPQADAIAVEKLRQQVGKQFVSQTDEAANMPSPDVLQKVRPMLQRLDIPEPTRALGSTQQSIYLRSFVQRNDQLAAPLPPPPIQNGYEAALQVHESAINNSLGYLLSGRTMNQAQLDKLLADAGRPAPVKSENDDEEEEEAFEIDFANSRPIIFEAREGKIRLGVRGERFSQGSRDLKRKLEITALYVPAKLADGSIILLREGEVDVKFPGQKRLGVREAGMKAPIKKNFSKVFPDTLMDQPLVVPQTVKADALRGRSYRPREVTAADGWLTVLLR